MIFINLYLFFDTIAGRIELSDHLTDLKNQYSKLVGKNFFEESKEFLSGDMVTMSSLKL